MRGADHLGRTLRRRAEEGIKFLDRVLHPPGPDLDPALQGMIEVLREAKEQAEGNEALKGARVDEN